MKGEDNKKEIICMERGKFLVNNVGEGADRKGENNSANTGEREESCTEIYEERDKGQLITKAPKNHTEELEREVKKSEEANQERHMGGYAVRKVKVSDIKSRSKEKRQFRRTQVVGKKKKDSVTIE